MFKAPRSTGQLHPTLFARSEEERRREDESYLREWSQCLPFRSLKAISTAVSAVVH